MFELLDPSKDNGAGFLNSDNRDASAVVANYNEAYERKVAEEIWSWWISKKSFKSWFADKFQQGKLFTDEDFEE